MRRSSDLTTDRRARCTCGRNDIVWDGDSGWYPYNRCCAPTYLNGVVVAIGDTWLTPDPSSSPTSVLITNIPYPPLGTTTALYRHLDGAGGLLYAGISDRLRERSRWHHRHSPWASFVAQLSVEWFSDRDLAAAAEREAIKIERPLFNRIHAAPETKHELEVYLLMHAQVAASADARQTQK